MWVDIALAQHFDNVVSKVVLHVILVVLCLIRFLLFEGLASRVHDLRNSMSAIVIGVLVLLIIFGLGVVMVMHHYLRLVLFGCYMLVLVAFDSAQQTLLRFLKGKAAAALSEVVWACWFGR